MALVKLTSYARHRVLDGEAVLLNLRDGQYYALDQVGTRMLALACSLETEQDVVWQITEEFEVSDAQCLQDLRGFLEELRSRGLVEATA